MTFEGYRGLRLMLWEAEMDLPIEEKDGRDRELVGTFGTGFGGERSGGDKSDARPRHCKHGIIDRNARID